VDTVAVQEAVDSVARILQADGADLELVAADSAMDRVELRLEVADARCAECIVPPDQLKQIVNDAIRRRVPTEFELILNDPRTATSNV
jgi:Fe-S cluster biogenesis protein NfuA